MRRGCRRGRGGRLIRALLELAGTQAVLERTSHVLATLSSGVGVAIAAAAEGDLLEHVHFSRLAAGAGAGGGGDAERAWCGTGCWRWIGI